MSKLFAVFIILIALSIIFLQTTRERNQPSNSDRTTSRNNEFQQPRRDRNRQNRKSKRRRSSTAASVSGRAHVVDGDSLEINNISIRLFGVDAPEGRQYCQTKAGEDWPCGRQASAALRRFINNRSVTCIRQDTDKYGRMIALCEVDNVDLNGWLTANGHALAYRKFTRDYVDEEQSAKAAKRGIWRGDFTPPWQWRRENRR